MKKILVLGSSGMAGHVVTQTMIESGFDVTNLTANKPFNKETIIMDLTEKEKFDEFLKGHQYDVIINCVGLLVQASENRQDLSAYLNSYLPHYLEYKFKDSKTKIIHMSTDCVFSGENGPYKEDSPYDGQLFYDRSKALGEVKNEKDLTFRMSIIGPDMLEEGVGLFNWYWKQTGEVTGYSKSIWTGVTTIQLAKCMVAAIEENLTGLYHLVPSESISKFDLLKTFNEVFKRDDIILKKVDGVAADKTLVNTRKDFSCKVPGYREMIEDMKKWIHDHAEFYPNYNLEKK